LRAKPHSSPLFFSNSTYLKLFVLLILLFAVVLVGAAVFVYYPASINANWVNPPVTFFNPGTSGVSVTLYDDNTRADIEVTSPGILVRTQRNAFIWDDFSTNPFQGNTRRLTVLGNCQPGSSWDGNNQYVIFDASSSGSGGYNLDHMVAYYSGNEHAVPTGTNKVYLLMKTRRLSDAYGLWKGFFLFTYDNPQPPNRRYYYVYMFWDYPNSGISRIYPNGFLRLATISVGDGGGDWYFQWGVRDRNSGDMEYKIYSSTGVEIGTVTATDNTYLNTPVRVGFGGALNRGEVFAFDEFVACADADPSYVNVTGLQSGWTVILKDSNGGTVDQRTADSTGSVSLNVLTRPIIRSARFEIVLGDVVILNQSFPFNEPVVGGDVYECMIRDMNILGFHNYDSKDYNVYVRVESLQVPSGYSGSINLWVRVGTVGSTPIRIVGSNIQQGTTSPVMLGYGASGYIHGTFSLSPPPSTPVVLTLSFHYYIPSSEVEVEYPITVRIHS